MKNNILFLICLGMVFLSSVANAVVIDFEGLAHATEVTNQFSGATFSSNAGFVNQVLKQSQIGPRIGAGDNFLCTASAGSIGGFNCAQETIINFANPVSGLSFLQVGDNASGVIGFVDVFENNLFSSTVNIIGNNDSFIPNLVDLTAFNNVTSIRIYGITDPGGLGWDNFQFSTTPFVSVDSADLAANSISVTLSGLGSSAPSPLSIELVGEQNTFQTSFNNKENVGEGTHLVTLDRPSIPEDIYTKIIATWKLSTGDVISQDYLISPVWRVLGLVRHSQYNTPAETACSGQTKTAWVFDSNCNFTSTTLNPKFALQVYINGTGDSIQHGIVKYSKLCSSNYPRGANARNSFLLVDEITGSCNKVMTNIFQATYPNPKKPGTPDCGDTTVLVEESNRNRIVKEIQDYCPDCKDGHHIDNYTNIEACSGGAVGDLGNFWTAIVGAK